MTKSKKEMWRINIENAAAAIADQYGNDVAASVFWRYDAHGLRDLSPSYYGEVFSDLELIANDNQAIVQDRKLKGLPEHRLISVATEMRSQLVRRLQTKQSASYERLVTDVKRRNPHEVTNLMKNRTGSHTGYLRFGLKVGRRKPNESQRQPAQNLHPQYQTVGARN